MLSIRDGEALARALKASIDNRIKRLLSERRKQLGDVTGQAHFTIVQQGDTPADLERTIGFSIFQNPADGAREGDPDFTPGWEWIQDHGWGWEQAWIMDDSGFAHVIIIPKEQGVSHELLNFCQQYASEHA